MVDVDAREGNAVIVVRTVFQAQFGKGGELAALQAETSQVLMRELGVQRKWRLLTDLSGPFDTVVLEIEVESLAEWEQTRPRLFQSQAFRESMQRTQGLIVNGRNEVYTIEAEG